MKTIIAGSREIKDYPLICRLLNTELDWIVTEVVSGTAQGVDRAGESWARSKRIPVKCFPADWKKFGTSAGNIRNEEMANYADAAFIIWDGKSSGTKDMINQCKVYGLKYRVIDIRLEA